MFLQKVSKSMQFMKVTFQNAGNLHIKKDLRDTLRATRREPARTPDGDSKDTTRTLKC